MIMKNRIIILFTFVAMLLLGACSTTKYYFCQLFQTEPAENTEQFSQKDGYLVYENSQCILYYYFWAEGGNTNFKIYNKTDDVLMVDLSRSFFTLNGIAYDLFQNSSYSQGYVVGSGSSTSSSTSHSSYYFQSRTGGIGANVSSGSAVFTNKSISAVGGSVGAAKSYHNTDANQYTNAFSVTNSTFQSKSVEKMFHEKQLISIPPHYSKEINSYSIVNVPLLMCDLEQYPSTQTERIFFPKSTSPIVFSLYITYRIGEQPDWHAIENKFYVNMISNYAEPSVVEYVERAETCDNKKDVVQRTPSVKLYDQYLKKNICVPSSSFYLWYDVSSYTQLYKRGSFRYSDTYKAYWLTGSGNLNGGTNPETTVEKSF